LVISKKTGELVVGTHGRGVWILDISVVDHVARFGVPKDFALLDILPFDRLPVQKAGPINPAKDFIGENPTPGAVIRVYIPNGDGLVGVPSVKIVDGSGKTVANLQGTKEKGFQQFFWPVPESIAEIGGGMALSEPVKKQLETSYRIKAELDGKVIEKTFIIRERP
jgi:hypothetical protein